MILHGNLQLHAGAIGIASNIVDLLKRWDSDSNANGVNVYISDGTHLWHSFNNRDANRLLVFYARGQWYVGLILRAIARVNCYILEVVTIVWIL